MTKNFQTMQMNISIVAPAYNEALGIEVIVLEWINFLEKSPEISNFEIIVCNDGSTDETGKILDAIADARLKPIHLIKNQGAAAALSIAIQQTRYEWVFLLDSDGQFPIEILTQMIKLIKNSDKKAIFTARLKKEGLIGRMGSRFSSMLCNLLHGSHVKDFNSACKLVFGPLIRSFHLEAKTMNYSPEMTSRILESRVPYDEVDIQTLSRKMGKSHFKFFRDGTHRCLFILYLALRLLLIKLKVLRRAVDDQSL